MQTFMSIAHWATNITGTHVNPIHAYIRYKSLLMMQTFMSMAHWATNITGTHVNPIHAYICYKSLLMMQTFMSIADWAASITRISLTYSCPYLLQDCFDLFIQCFWFIFLFATYLRHLLLSEFKAPISNLS